MSAPLPVSETFVSVQGEGKLTGMPSAFIRLSGCNLRCAWCDTPYASWAPEKTLRTIDDLADEAVSSGVGHAVVTGGEPMIHGGVVGLCARLRERGLHVTIETAGTVDRDAPCDLMSVSPKLANSTPWNGFTAPTGSSATVEATDDAARLAIAERHERERINMDVMRALLGPAADRQVKFVVTGPDDLGEIEAIVSELRETAGLAAGDVILMPEGVVAGATERARWAAGVCMERGWRYGHRLHVELFGDTRGT